MEVPPPVLRFAAIQSVKRKQDLADLSPKSCFVAAEAVEGVIGQIGKTEKASRELSVWTRSGPRFKRLRGGARPPFRLVRHAV